MTRTLEELREYLVGEWKFDNNFLDTSGNGNHGTPTDIEWKPTSRGLKPHIKIGNTVSMNEIVLSPNDSTISLWVANFKKIDSNYNDHHYILSKNDRYRNYIAISSTGSIAIESDVNGDIFGIATTGTFPFDFRPHQITVTASNAVTQIYLDGIPVNMTGINADAEVKLTNIGCITEQNDTSPDCTVCGILHYSTALTSDEVLNLYNSTKNAVGVRPAERSFTHRLQPDVDDNTVFATDMSTKNSDGTLMDLSW